MTAAEAPSSALPAAGASAETPSAELPSHPRGDRKLVVHAALVGNVAVAVTKLIAALVTGSAAMFSEAVHSLVDCGNEGLLLYGFHRAARRPDLVHPFGYGREIYFWSFIVALMLFALGAGVSLYQGVLHVLSPEPVERTSVSYVVLALAFLFEGASWTVALRAFRKTKGSLSYWRAFRQSKDPPGFMILFEDSAALIGIVIAALGIFGAQALDMPVLDGVASILIGVVLAVTAILLAAESKSLLIGERAAPALTREVCRIAASQAGVRHADSALTAQLSPDQAIVALSVQFDPALRAAEIETVVAAVERRVRQSHPEVVALFIKPQSHAGFEAAKRSRFGAPSVGRRRWFRKSPKDRVQIGDPDDDR